jgi:hypothetical protein
LVCWLAGCFPFGRSSGSKDKLNKPRVQALDVSDAAGPVRLAGPLAVHGARNEWVGFAVELTDVPAGQSYSLRWRTPRQKESAARIPAGQIEAFQIVTMPVDVNRAGYVRHTGLTGAVSELPRALLPVAHRNGRIDVRALRPGTGPALAAPRLWVDVHIPADAPAGDYSGAIELIPPKGKKPVASLPVSLTVYDFAIPEVRDLQIVSRLSWEALARLYPDRFQSVTPRLLSRSNPEHQPAVRTLDQLVVLAQRHRLGVVVPRLQPTVKWPLRDSGVAEPVVDWDDYDQLVAPWMSGGAFPDGVPVGFWPLPAPDFLQQFQRGPQLAYWAEAARHFEQNDWLNRSAVWMESAARGRARPAHAAELSQQAGQILRLHDRLRAALPLEEDQLHLTERDGPEMIDPATAGRLWAAAPGLVFTPPTQSWPEAADAPHYWLRTDLPGLVPYAGAGGDQHDLRLWAWLAFLRQATMIAWGDPLPTASKPDQPADPDETVWFYPGHWFGLDQPVPTIQLKWLRRAQQDYQYLHLARERGEVLNALLMARLITKPVEVQPGQAPDPAYALMCGTADPKAWDAARRLLARSILLRDRGHAADAAQQQALYLDTLRWAEPQERPLVTGRTVRWLWDNSEEHKALSVRVGIDVYNASDNRPDRNLLRWGSAATGWQVDDKPLEIPALATYNVRREYLDARFDLDKVTPAARGPVGVSFTNGFTNRDSTLNLMLPVATSERVEGRRVVTDGKFDEWDAEDLIQDGPLVQMLSRPSLQRQELRPAATPATVYTGWAEDNFYFAFGVGGITPANLLKGSQNFVDYQFRRGWGEDLCAVLIQPVFEDNTLGPTLHVVCKPTGLWVERKLDAKRNANPWQPLEGTGIRYKAVIDGTDWRGEIAIPWRAICDPERGVPPLLRFNFIQHRTATGESASWAGPIDFGRDDAFTGVLHLREARAPGMGQAVDAYGNGSRR